MAVVESPAWLARLTTWLERFEPVFAHRAQRGGLRRYVEGVLCDSRRKSMAAMWARLRDPGTYQGLQYFITEATWDAPALWRQLRATIPARSGVLVLDGTGFPKQGDASVGVQRQYSGTLGKIGNCQVAVTAALWTGVQAWLVGAQLYLPEGWLTPAQRDRGRIPKAVRFQEKWRQALTLLQQVRASQIEVTAVAADAEFGDCTAFRHALHQLRLAYAVGVSSRLTVFLGTPALVSEPRPGRGRPRARPRLAAGVQAQAICAMAGTAPAGEWRVVSWRNGTQAPWRARFWRRRVTPAHDWRRGRLAPEVWLLCQRDVDGSGDNEVLPGQPAQDGVLAGRRAARASALGHRAAVRRAEVRTRPRRLRWSIVSRVEPSRGAHRPGLCVSASRTTAPRAVPPDASTGARSDDRCPHRLLLRDASAQTQDAAETGGNPAENLTNSY